MAIGPISVNTSAVNQGASAPAKVSTPPQPPLTANETASRSAQSAGVALTVSNEARALEQASADIDAKKVDTVKAAIQDGSYSVNAEAIADKLLADSQEQISRAKN